MNYEEMSDFEINSAVHNLVKNLGFSLEFLGCDRIKWSRKGEQPIFTGNAEYSKNGLINYCDNPFDAWPIINSIFWELVRADELGVTEWAKRIRADDGSDKLRAAMIVFLIIRGGKCQKS